jgi:hypothetical protein
MYRLTRTVANNLKVGILVANLDFDRCGKGTVAV